MDKYYVYAHIDPETNSPFYVGMGKDRRAFNKSRDDQWRHFVEKYVPNYEVKFIAEEISQELAYEIENLFISRFGKIHNGKGILLNWLDGGDGGGVLIGFHLQDPDAEIDKALTEYGRTLLETELKNFNTSKAESFLMEIVEEDLQFQRNSAIQEISKKGRPNKPWIVPFCIPSKISKRDKFTVHIEPTERIIDKISKPITIDELPDIEFEEAIIHRILMYLDLIIQESVWIERGDERLSISDSTWVFSRDNFHRFTKIIQTKNSNLNLNVKYLGRDKSAINMDLNADYLRKDIHEFEINVIRE